MPLKIALVAAEPSGDLLGAALIAAIQKQHPDASFIGIGGEQMIARGMQSRYPMERLSIMGIIEILPHLPGLLRMRKELREWLLSEQPDVFIGIDAPDFNLGLEKRLKQAGINTIHYVSPTVWAWKQGRVKTIRKAVDRVLCLFPFEQDFLEKHQVPASYVGHPLADQLPLEVDRSEARSKLHLPNEGKVLALLPGSRLGEVSRLSDPFIQSAVILTRQLPGLKVIVPVVSKATRIRFEESLASFRDQLDVKIIEGDATSAMAAADVVLLASGTATLQGLLCKRPMVVGYRLNALTYLITRLLKLIKIPYVAMANLLCGKMLAPEMIQNDCRPERIVPALMTFFTNQDKVDEVVSCYSAIHHQLRCDAANTAAREVLAMIPGEGCHA